MKDTGDSFFIRYCRDGPTVQVAAVFYESAALIAAFDDSADSTEETRQTRAKESRRSRRMEAAGDLAAST